MDRYRTFGKFPELRTKRLILREITIDDVEWYLRHFSTPEIVEGQGFQGPDGFEGAEQELRQYIIDLFAKREGFRWGLVLKGDTRLIGSAGYYKWFVIPGHRAEMGYDLDPDYWRQGLMKEALTAIIDFGFTRMKLLRIEVMIGPHNKRSMKLVRGLGFRKEGVLREHSLDENGKPEDDVIFALLRKDWKATTGSM